MNSKRRNNNRKRARKPKFLSLCRLVTADDESKRRLTEMHSAEKTSKSSHHLNLVEDRENHDHENVAFFFSAADGGGAAASLCGLLDGSTAAGSHSSHTTNNFSSRAEDLSPSSLTYAYGGESESGAALVKNALRNRERDSSEDKWVCYSEVVERKVTVKEEEVTSSAVDLRPVGIKRLSLKLDYQEIMKAWSDKGPLYIDGGENSSQIVPDVNDDFFGNEIWGCTAGLWTVPKMEGDIDHSKGYMRVNNEEALKMVQREASVLRYKEKRQNRLFSKKIRYEVRKLNAQKRPRLKGRFVKRS